MLWLNRNTFAGSYRPDGLLSGFDGISTKGTWTLRVLSFATVAAAFSQRMAADFKRWKEILDSIGYRPAQ